jgi:hypothetical protein
MIRDSFASVPLRALACAAFLLSAGPVEASTTNMVRPDAGTATKTTDIAGNGFAFLNTDAAGSGLVGQVGPSIYPNSHAGLAGVYDASGTTVGFGVFGLSTTGDGIYGKSTARGYYGVYGVAVGNAVVGSSSGASGVLGQTSVANQVSDSQFFPFDTQTWGGRAGVVGNDNSPVSSSSDYEDENAGVIGFSKYGLAGVVGVLSGSSAYGSVAGVLGTNFAAGESGVYGDDDSSSSQSAGVSGRSNDGTGVTAGSNSGEAINAFSRDIAIEADNLTTSSLPALLVQGYNDSSSIPLIIARNNYDSGASQSDVFSVGSDGTVIAAGSITGSSSPLVVTRAATGARYVAYGSRTSSPTIEDVGMGSLTNGYATVRLEPIFASTIDTRSPYIVFLSPEGENNGLYVTAKTGTSFVVREVHGGKSTLSFGYRIVARPLDMSRAQRLPDARTAAAWPAFDDRKVNADDADRKAMRAKFARHFQPTR